MRTSAKRRRASTKRSRTSTKRSRTSTKRSRTSTKRSRDTRASWNVFSATDAARTGRSQRTRPSYNDFRVAHEPLIITITRYITGNLDYKYEVSLSLDEKKYDKTFGRLKPRALARTIIETLRLTFDHDPFEPSQEDYENYITRDDEEKIHIKLVFGSSQELNQTRDEEWLKIVFGTPLSISKPSSSLDVREYTFDIFEFFYNKYMFDPPRTSLDFGSNDV
jgi:hypothetical protein